jgi:alpha-tubulin suppressor-like RCC1 family protein
LTSGEVRCWGTGTFNRLGYGNTNTIGDDETPASAGSVDVGGAVVQLAAGQTHTCALLVTGAVRCWGYGPYGQLGYPNTTEVLGVPASAGDVDVGGPVSQIVAGYNHTCALLQSGDVRCWGSGYGGKLGYGNTEHIGIYETPASAGSVQVL